MLLKELLKDDTIFEGVLDLPQDSSEVTQLEALMVKLEATKKALGIANHLQNPTDKKRHRSRIMTFMNQIRAMFNKLADKMEADLKQYNEVQEDVGIYQIRQIPEASELLQDMIREMARVLKDEMDDEQNASGYMNVAMIFEEYLMPFAKADRFSDLRDVARDALRKIELELDRLQNEASTGEHDEELLDKIENGEDFQRTLTHFIHS